MTRRAAQLNIRSDKAKQRVADLAFQTGKTATQVVEEAVMAYRPPPSVNEPPVHVPEGLKWNGKFLVIESRGGRIETMEETNRSIDEMRSRDPFGD